MILNLLWDQSQILPLMTVDDLLLQLKQSLRAIVLILKKLSKFVKQKLQKGRVLRQSRGGQMHWEEIQGCGQCITTFSH